MGVAAVLFAAAVVAAAMADGAAAPASGNVTYDGRSLIVGGEKKIVFSGSVHYPRSTPEMWPRLIQRGREGGLDAIQTYVFWNLHEPLQGRYNFEGRYDLVRFIKEIQAQGLYASLRIGPYIESEWKFGGLPFWLRDVSGIVFRSDNEPFKFHMQRFVTKITNMMKAEGLFASQGGPIIITQIENEYQTVEAAFHEKGPPYVRWAAATAVGLNTGVPWMMCKQDDAPDPVINSCNGMNCGETFKGPNSPGKPSLWTENWTSMYQRFGEEPYVRTAQDIAFATALFIAKGGSFVNYYMYHGGTNLGGFGSSFVSTSYYDEAPLDEYGLVWQPKWAHLKDLHAAVKSVSQALLFGQPSNISLGPLQEAFVFDDTSGKCAAFLCNNDRRQIANVQFREAMYVLPARSISILSDCQTVTFNSGKVRAQWGVRLNTAAEVFNSPERWESFNDTILSMATAPLSATGLVEQISTTKAETGYLWYSTSFNYTPNFGKSVLHVHSLSHVVHAFINGVYKGSSQDVPGEKGTVLDKTIAFKSGKNDISLLSVMVGMPDAGAYLERRVAGIQTVIIRGSASKSENLSNYKWGFQPGLWGERMKIYTRDGYFRANWTTGCSPTTRRLTWFKTTFDSPSGTDPVALNLNSMGKGEAWVNGVNIGRYHVPRSFLEASGNLLVLLEEEIGDPLRVSIDTVSVQSICDCRVPNSKASRSQACACKELSGRDSSRRGLMSHHFHAVNEEYFLRQKT
ncbi:beta-galactosidase 6-like isoform X2 [Wolffia australiana]